MCGFTKVTLARLLNLGKPSWESEMLTGSSTCVKSIFTWTSPEHFPKSHLHHELEKLRLSALCKLMGNISSTQKLLSSPCKPNLVMQSKENVIGRSFVNSCSDAKGKSTQFYVGNKLSQRNLFRLPDATYVKESVNLQNETWQQLLHIEQVKCLTKMLC